MLIKKAPDIKTAEITDEKLYLNRRQFIQAAGTIVGAATAATVGVAGLPRPALAQEPIPDVVKGPFGTTEKMNPFEDITTYNNFYEFGIDKTDPSENSGKFHPRPWTVEVGGLCNKPATYDLDDLIKPFPLEERVYQMRCVEAWSIVVPWVGFPLGDLIKRLEPTAEAKFVEFTTVYRPEEMPGQRRNVLAWPYKEGLRLDEAMHPLAILAVGLYGKTLLNQNGAPIRLVVPWKYGFKGIKSIVKIQFVAEQPATAWNTANAREYGFYSNVNPEVDHPRWSQATERRLGEFFRRKTLMFNGYADQVASLYTGMDLRKNF